MPAAGFWGNSKPPAGTQVDWGHPLAWGLVAAYLFAEGDGGAANDVSNRLPLVLQGGTTWEGRGLRCDSTTDGAAALLPTWLKLQPPLTLVCVMTVLNIPTSSALYFGADYDGADGDPFVAYRFDAPGSSAFRLAYNSAGSFASIAAANGTIDARVGKRVMLVGVITRAGTKFYLDGALVASGSGVASINYSTGFLNVGRSPAVSRNANAVIELGLVAQAAWTQADVSLFTAQPYAMFAAPAWRRYFAVPPPPGLGQPMLRQPYRVWNRRRVA